jgi:hypothetical protein
MCKFVGDTKSVLFTSWQFAVPLDPDIIDTMKDLKLGESRHRFDENFGSFGEPRLLRYESS